VESPLGVLLPGVPQRRARVEVDEPHLW
jgi:hypothetical protein